MCRSQAAPYYDTLKGAWQDFPANLTPKSLKTQSSSHLTRVKVRASSALRRRMQTRAAVSKGSVGYNEEGLVEGEGTQGCR